jgi:E3 ubiquitin-protein ligase HUWE1
MEDSFYQLRSRRPEELKGRLSVQFNGEEGIDAGGVSREWYSVLAKEMFNPNYALFAPTAEQTFQPNKRSDINPDHLDYFKFVGMVIGKALMDGQLLDAHFTRSFYKHILGLPVSYQDMEAIDPDYFKNLKWILENDVSDLDLTFSMQQEEFGIMTIVDLKPGGRNIPLTNENKQEYVRLVTEMKMTTAIKPQIKSFLEGFSELIKPSLIAIFTPSELELLISGLPDIDIEDLRKNTEYRGFTVDSPVIQWFWQIVGEFAQEEKALLLQFVTGTSKVPLDGFKALVGMSGPQKFQIYKAHDTTRLPTAHTCFNQLDLPEYPSTEVLKRNLLLAIREASEGFGFG